MHAERRLTIRERADGLYYVITYLLAKMIEELALAALLSAIFSSYVFFGVKYQGSFGLYWIVYFITLSNGIGELPDDRASSCAYYCACVSWLG